MSFDNGAYIEVMMEGDPKGRVFTFPIPTYNITPEFDWDSPNTDLLFEMTAKNSLELKRKMIQRHIDDGLYPYTKRSLV